MANVEPRLLHDQRQRLINAVALLAQDNAGRELIRWLLEVTGIHTTAGVPVDVAHAGYCEGKREIGERLIRLLFAAQLPA